MNEVHGLARVRKVAVVTDNEPGQTVLVSDAETYVRIALSTSSFPAELTPAEARFIADRLIEAATRAEAFSS